MKTFFLFATSMIPLYYSHICACSPSFICISICVQMYVVVHMYFRAKLAVHLLQHSTPKITVVYCTGVAFPLGCHFSYYLLFTCCSRIFAGEIFIHAISPLHPHIVILCCCNFGYRILCIPIQVYSYLNFLIFFFTSKSGRGCCCCLLLVFI